MSLDVADELLHLVVGPFGGLILAVSLLGYIGRKVAGWVSTLWREHLRVDHARDAALEDHHRRIDAMRASNDANMRIIERAVTQNERLVQALARKGGTTDEG